MKGSTTMERCAASAPARSGDGAGRFAEEIPGAARDHDERDDPGDSGASADAFRLAGFGAWLCAGFAWAGTPTSANRPGSARRCS